MDEPMIRVGGAEVYPILESILWCPSTVYMPGVEDIDPLVAEVSEWAHVTRAADGWLATHVRSYVIKADGQIGLVDAGVGADSLFETSPNWRIDCFPFLEQLAAIDVTPERIDWVVSTHMHPDHVGWYAQLEGDTWRPTFANARYLYVSPEWEHASVNGAASVRARISAVRDAGLVEIVSPTQVVTPSVRLDPSHGHTPGHVYVIVTSGSDQAIITGDVLHHKLQLAVPNEPDGTDRQAPEEALATRHAFYQRYVDSDVLVIGGHFEPPAAGYLTHRGAGYALDATRLP